MVALLTKVSLECVKWRSVGKNNFHTSIGFSISQMKGGHDMSDGALRGSRLGATSYETDTHVELAPRQPVSYDCPNGHVTVMPFSLEAEIPLVWECRCGSEALLRDGDRPEPKAAKHVRTHWDMLLERRNTDELEVLLQERLELLRTDQAGESAGRVAPKRRKSA